MPKASKPKTSTRRTPTSRASKPKKLDSSAPSRNNVSTEGQGKNDATKHVNYILHCYLNLYNDPLINRVLSVPAHTTLQNFHQVLQIAFGWASCHAWHFEIRPQSTDDDDDEDIESHTSIQSEIHVSDMPEVMRGIGCKAEHASKVKLSDVFNNDKYKDDVQLTYEYDHGDSWRHNIILCGIEAPGMRTAMMGKRRDDNIILCMSGEGHPCAEDCGAEPGWEHLRELFEKPRMKDPDGRRQWYKQMCANGDPKGLNPWQWDRNEVNDRLAQLKL